MGASNYLGISCGYHDAGVSLLDDNGNILYAGHSERYSKQKHDSSLNSAIITDALSYATSDQIVVSYYEKPLLKYLRQWAYNGKESLKNIFVSTHIGRDILRQLGNPRVRTYNHHLSHAAAFQTSSFDDATVVVIDAIGEWDTASIYHAYYDGNGIAQYKLLWSLKYPNSVGLFYSAITKLVGLKPLDEEYILMGMAAYGKPNAYRDMFNNEIADAGDFTFKNNLHSGIDGTYLAKYNDYDIASSAQTLLEWLLSMIMIQAKSYSVSRNLVYSGGVALNCVANRLLTRYFDKIWIMPNPGDCGSSLGAAALRYGKSINWKDCYLGYNIGGEYPVAAIISELESKKICGVANGRAEWGPRALGNRSLLADPRGDNIKDIVNNIKRRQKFRPFAPVILEEYVHEYFDMPIGWNNSRYMQVVAACKHVEKYPAIVHIDGTSRVQTVPADGSGIRRLLEKWYSLTGCPMLLNTSLNIRGEPMVNDKNDAVRFESLYGVKVLV